ncbi:hypothetical protein FGRMN_744 [Fusarium graminum]|nr:hypothetical protein FGRMN_744 [Fusarium graminum]
MPPTNLIIVCCHGVWLGGPTHGQHENEWLIADFQRGETSTFVQHIRTGVEALAQDQLNSVLVFTGISEAAGYKNIAAGNNYWGLLENDDVSDAVMLEERALDSYHNILFSLTLFYAKFKEWPSHITVVSHGFKKERLVDGHCAAIGFPLNRVSFVGIDPPGMAAVSRGQDKEEAIKGVGFAMGEWNDDPHGRGESLAGKRAKRNPWAVRQGVFPCDDCEQGGLGIKIENGSEVLDEKVARPW